VAFLRLAQLMNRKENKLLDEGIEDTKVWVWPRAGSFWGCYGLTGLNRCCSLGRRIGLFEKQMFGFNYFSGLLGHHRFP
jgi:hypothetical protein